MPKKKFAKHIINREYCKGCRICVEFCPQKVLDLDDQEKVNVVRPEECIACKICELMCPDMAIEIKVEV